MLAELLQSLPPQMLLGALQSRPQLRSEAELEEEARHLSAKAKTQAMKGGLWFFSGRATAMERQRWHGSAAVTHMPGR